MSAQLIEHGQHGQPSAEVRALAAHPAVSPLDLPAEVFRSGLDRRRENRAALMEWVRSALVEGVDFGRIHVVSKDKCRAGRNCTNTNHFSKPSLFKPGAEKICGMLGVTVHYPTLHDYEQTALHGVKLEHIIMRCEIHDAAGRVVADGVGARSLKQDYGDLNKALKMAGKSAHIDATLRMAGLSEVFTQDMEDMKHGQELEETAGHARGDQEKAGPAHEGGQAAPVITDGQRRRLEAHIAELGLDPERVKAWLASASRGSIKRFADLTPPLYQRLFVRLDEWARECAA